MLVKSWNRNLNSYWKGIDFYAAVISMVSTDGLAVRLGYDGRNANIIVYSF
jgi:hypothetical protein